MSASVKVTWNGNRVHQEIKADINARLDLAGELIASTIRRNLSTPGPAASAPGQFPHAQSGRLRNSVTYSTDASKMTLRVGTNVEYAAFLEGGTRRMEPRPFLLRTVFMLKPQLRAIFTRPRKSLFSKATGFVKDLFLGKEGGFEASRE